jgi:two-component system CheB/CheR fusion protein
MTFSDITAAKRLEAELRSTGGMWQALVQAIPLIIVGLAGDGEILEFNPQAERRLGRKRAEIMGGNFFELFMLKADQPKAAAELQEFLLGKSTQVFTTRILATDQTQITLHWSARPIPAADGKAAGIIAIGQDIEGGA